MDAQRDAYRIALAATLTLVGCGSNSPTSVPAQDANTSVGARDGAADTVATNPATCQGAPDYSSGAQTCNSLVNDATPVLFTTGVGDVPTFTGGTIMDGLYHATKTEAWGASTGTGRRFTLVVLEDGTKFYYAGEILDDQGGVATPLVAITTASTSGNQLNQTVVCLTGSVQIPVESYTATSAELILAASQGSVVSVTTYTRVGCP